MKEQDLMTSAIILTIASFLTRTIGMFSVIYLSNTIGSEGIGLYQLLMSIYSLGIIFASAGISVSVSKLVAEEMARLHFQNTSRVMHSAFFLSTLLSTISCSILFIFTEEIALLFIQDNRVIWGLKMLSFSIPFIALSSCFKGYFYAVKKVIYPASADILEQLVKLFLTIILVNIYTPKGLNYTYTAIGLCITISEMVSCSYMFTLYMLDTRKTFKNIKPGFFNKNTLYKLLQLIIPIALIAYISSLFSSIENLLIPISLKKFGASSETSLSVYGIIKGMVLPILFFPSAFLTAFTTTLIPEISRSNALRQRKRVIYTSNRVLQFTFILSFLVANIFINYSQEIGLVFYKNAEVGKMLRVLSLIVPFMYIEVVSDSILKGLGVQISCLKYSIIDSLFRVSTIYFLLPIKGISAFIGIMIISNILTSVLNFNRLLKEIQLKTQFSNWITKPMITAIAAGVFSKYLTKHLIYSPLITVQLLFGVFLSIIIYSILLFLVECVTPEDMTWLKRYLHPLF